MIEISTEVLALLFIVAVVAGWVDAVAGGGGLITIPTLLLTGISPAAAIATNKLQGSFGTLTATIYFIKKGAVSIRGNLVPLGTVCLGSIIGGIALTRIDAAYLGYLVPVLLILIGLYFLLYSENLDENRKPRMSHSKFNSTAAPALGFYDGFFGPGTGSFMASAFVTLRGFSIRDATANAKLFNFASNISALMYFIIFGEIVWIIGGIMIGGQILGAYLGAHVALKAGAKVIRPITIVVCFVMSARAIWALLTAT